MDNKLNEKSGIIDDSSGEFYSELERQPYTQLLHFPSRYAGFFVSDLNVLVPLRTFRAPRKSKRLFLAKQWREKRKKQPGFYLALHFEKNFRQTEPRLTCHEVSQACSSLSKKKKNKVLENEYFLPRWKENFQEERTRNEILRVGREEKKKSESLQLPSSILSLRSYPRFPFFNVISQASDPAGFRFPFLFRALAPFLVSPSLAVTAPIYRKSIPRPMFPFVFLFVPFKERESFYGGTRMTKTEHLQEETLSLSFFLSLWRKTIFPRSNSSWTLFKSFDSHSIYLSRRDI